MLSTKDYVLATLIKSGTYVSGEKISARLNISRAAINVAVKSLRSDGYTIESSTNKGYKLTERPNVINQGELFARLNEERMSNIICLESTPSTNMELKNLLYDGAPAGTVIIANEQTKGRGRLGRSFISPPNTGLYLSYLLRPRIKPDSFDSISSVTAWSAVAVCNAIENACGLRPEIKWVNDILVNNMKVCGILTEMFLESESGLISGIVIGIGININQKQADFPSELQNTASSLSAQDGGNIFSRCDIAAELITELDKLAAAWPEDKSEYLAMYRSSCITLGKEVGVIKVHTNPDERPRRGIALAVNDDFSLKVAFNDNTTEDLSSGEVSVRGIYGYT